MATSKPSLSLWSPSYSSLISLTLIHSMCLAATHSCLKVFAPALSLPGGPFPKESYSSSFFTSLKSCLKYPVFSETFPRHPIWNHIFSPTPCASFLLDFTRNHLPSNIYTSYLFGFFPLSLTTMECKLLGDRNFGLFCLWLYSRCLAQNLHIIETWSAFFKNELINEWLNLQTIFGLWSGLPIYDYWFILKVSWYNLKGGDMIKFGQWTPKLLLSEKAK